MSTNYGFKCALNFSGFIVYYIVVFYVFKTLKVDELYPLGLVGYQMIIANVHFWIKLLFNRLSI